MADRTWNAVDARLYEEMWSREAKLVFGVIVARSPNPYGVYDVPYFILKSLFSDEEIETALDELVTEGAIKLYRDRRVLWIVKKWRREGNPNIYQQKGACNTIQSGFKEVWEDFRGVYEGCLTGVNGVSEGSKRGERGVRKGSPSESDSDTDTDSDTDIKKKSGKPPPSQRFIQAVCELFPDLDIKKDQERIIAQAAVLEEIERIDGTPMDDLMPALKWAVSDDFWKPNFQSCAGLRKRKEGKGDRMKYEKIYAKFKSTGTKRPRYVM